MPSKQYGRASWLMNFSFLFFSFFFLSSFFKIPANDLVNDGDAPSFGLDQEELDQNTRHGRKESEIVRVTQPSGHTTAEARCQLAVVPACMLARTERVSEEPDSIGCNEVQYGRLERGSCL